MRPVLISAPCTLLTQLWFMYVIVTFLASVPVWICFFVYPEKDLLIYISDFMVT